MPAHLFQLPPLPLELWEKTVLCLPPREILGLRLLNKLSRDVIDRSPAIQYRLNLFSVRLEEAVVDDSMSVEDRRRLLLRYTRRWDHHSQGELWSLPISNPWQTVKHKHGHLICTEASVVGADMTDVRFLRLPSVSLGMPTKEWNLVAIPGWPLEIHPPSNLLVTSRMTDEKT
ncbi:hypothetical protein BDM02DRAFT_3119615 [Thelephora ganbajun]|uniref:Uncharacterized protein n=1 Tax=Thelephora ganbajun TaxID=370292 RepID=A0ACB6Z7Z2_THEGA|nr:hypothetical protein BDM02DRAFT_3119615 [Thelephora ganbajun]